MNYRSTQNILLATKQALCRCKDSTAQTLILIRSIANEFCVIHNCPAHRFSNTEYLFLAAVYTAGRLQGIREQKRKNPRRRTAFKYHGKECRK